MSDRAIRCGRSDARCQVVGRRPVVDARVRFGRRLHDHDRTRSRRRCPRRCSWACATSRSRTGRRPEPGPGELLLEVSHCGICGSDLHFLLEWGGRDRRDRGPRVLGHGRRGRRRRDRLGGRRPGRSAARRRGAASASTASRSRPSLCVERGAVGGDDGDWQGAFARYKTVHAAEALRVPDGLSLKHAALTEPLAVALHGITRAGGARPGTRWLVTGGGPIGFLSVAALKALGVDDIVVSEPQGEPARRCARSSARARVDPAELVDAGDAARHRRRAVRRRARVLGQRPRRRSRRSRSSSAAGTLVLVGAGMARPKFDPNRILLNELVITGAFVYDARRLPARARAARVGQAAERPARRAGGLSAQPAARRRDRPARGRPRGQGHDRAPSRVKEHDR